MHSRALPAALHLTALSAQPLRTGNLLADCERWCRDHLASPRIGALPGAGTVRAPAASGVRS